MEEQAIDARCAVHPDRSAGETCARCGNFMCVECSGGRTAGQCAACDALARTSRYVAHVATLGVVMMIHGGILTLVALYYLGLGGFLAYGFATEPMPATPGAEALPMAEIMLGAMGGVGVLHLAPGLLQLYAGYRVRVFRARGLGIGALLSGLLTTCGCYCMPTSAILAIWGLVVLVDDAVKRRFADESGSGT